MYSNTIRDSVKISGGDLYSIFKNDNVVKENNKNEGKKDFIVKRGDVFDANLGETRGSIQGKRRPFLVTSNWKCNNNSSVITGVPLTSQLHKNPIPTHVLISKKSGLNCDSIALVEQTMPLNKFDLISYVGHCSNKEMFEIENAIKIQNGIEIKKEANKKVFNISKINHLVSSIKELDEFINNFDKSQVNPIKRSRMTLIQELKDYCSDFNKNISLFYKDYTLNNNYCNYRKDVARA